jgi:Cu/Ag efflux pump CusA
MFSRFFIERPIFANVIAVVTIIFGAVAVKNLPVEQYGQITQPTVQVTTNYPGANATVVATRSPTRSKSRSTASSTCSTCRPTRRVTARTP